MRLIVIGLGLMLLAACASPIDTKQQSKQAPVLFGSVDDEIAKLQKDSDTLPEQFLDLANNIDYSKWSCGSELQTKTQNVVTNVSDYVAKIQLNGQLIKLGGLTVVEVADSSYAFGRLQTEATLLADTLTVCSSQKDLGMKFDTLSDQLDDAWTNTHQIEIQFIQNDEDKLNDLEQQHQQPIIQPIPQDRNDKT